MTQSTDEAYVVIVPVATIFGQPRTANWAGLEYNSKGTGQASKRWFGVQEALGEPACLPIRQGSLGMYGVQDAFEPQPQLERFMFL